MTQQELLAPGVQNLHLKRERGCESKHGYNVLVHADNCGGLEKHGDVRSSEYCWALLHQHFGSYLQPICQLRCSNWLNSIIIFIQFDFAGLPQAYVRLDTSLQHQ